MTLPQAPPLLVRSPVDQLSCCIPESLQVEDSALSDKGSFHTRPLPHRDAGVPTPMTAPVLTLFMRETQSFVVSQEHA